MRVIGRRDPGCTGADSARMTTSLALATGTTFRTEPGSPPPDMNSFGGLSAKDPATGPDACRCRPRGRAITAHDMPPGATTTSPSGPRRTPRNAAESHRRN
jgi:hypothetical protein